MIRILVVLLSILLLTACSFKCAIGVSGNEAGRPKLTVSCLHIEKGEEDRLPPIYRSNEDF